MALQVDPNHPQGLFNAGIVTMSTGDSTEAVLYWEKLIETQENSQQAARAKELVEIIKSKLNKS